MIRVQTRDLMDSRLAVRQIASQCRAQIRIPGFSGRLGRVAMTPCRARPRPATPTVNTKGTSPSPQSSGCADNYGGPVSDYLDDS
jgi:hypothetical protein